MNRPDLLASLRAATGDLQPTAGTTVAELNDLRRAFLESLGQPTGEVHVESAAAASTDDRLTAELQYVIAQHLSARPAATPVRLVRRESPLRLAIDPAIPEWSTALAPARTFGPFIDGAGRLIWHDLFTMSKQLHVRRSATGEDFLLLPFATPRILARPAPRVNITIPAGSIWIAARLFSASAPAGGYAGVRITGGTLIIGSHDHLTGDVLVVQPGETITLRVTLDHGAAVAGPASGPGADATNTSVTLPDSVTFVCAPAKLHAVETGPASLSAYGSSFALTRNHAATTYDADLRQVLVPLSASSHDLHVSGVRSTLFIPAGAATVQRAAWSLPVSVSPPTSLGEAAGAGYLLISVGAGLQARWHALAGPLVALTRVDILANGSTLLFISHASGPSARQTFELWQESEKVRSSLDITFRNRFSLWFVSDKTGFDSIQATGTALPHFDRPLAVSGHRIDNPIDVTYALLQRPGRLDLFLGTPQPQASARGPIALALTNALLTTTLIRQLSLNGPVVDGHRIDQGVLNLYFGLYQLVPTLPDPYAANFEPILNRDVPDGTVAVHAQVAWNDPAAPALAIELTSTTGQFEPVLPRIPQAGQRNVFFDRFSTWLGDVSPHGLTLLDVSSNADQLGVTMALTGRASPSLTIRDLSLSTAALNTRTFLFPEFQWEPVQNLPNPLTTDPKVPVTLRSPTDGSPALLGANSVRLVPIAPIPVATELVRAYHDDGARASVLFTLPFGIDAVALLNRRDRAFLVPADLQLLQPALKDLTGAREISLRAGRALAGEALAAILRTRPVLPGGARHLDNIVPAPTPDLTSVLGTLKSDFDGTFNDEVPVTRIDLSGYGANIFSNWVNDSDAPVSITQVAFDAFHGRTSFERIQMTSILWPCQATVVRTITIERYGSGSVIRWDSGWVATTPGLFWHKAAPGVTFHPGAAHGMFNIREIRDTDQIIPLGGGAAPVQAVYFDTDIEIEGVTRGQNKDGRVPARRQLGFIQRIPVPAPAGPAGVGALTVAELNELFGLQGLIGGSVDCVIKIGKSQHEKRVTGVFSAPAPPGQFAVAVQGSPILPASGHWSVVRVHNAAGKVEPVSAQLGIPLVREGAAKSGLSAKPLRWADPADLLSPPVTDYAFLFAGHSQRILYSRPKVEFNATDITSTLPPTLADPYAMLRAGGIFPTVSDAIPFDKPYPLSNTSGVLRFVPDKVSFPAPPGFKRPLVDLSTWLSDLNYNDGSGGPTRFIVDTAKTWNIDVERVSQILSFDPLGDIMTIVHDIHSPTDALDDFPKPNVILAPALDAAKDILTLLQSLSPTADPEGMPAPFHVDVSFSGTTFRLSAFVGFKLEGEDGEPIECGVGKIRGELRIGADLSAEILKAKVAGHVFLEITGSYQQEVFPLIYGGGLLRFRIGADETGATSVDLDACTMGSVGGTVVPGLVDLEATVKYGYYVRLEGGRFEPGIVLGMEGRAKLLSGFLGFSLAVEGRLLMERLALAMVADPADALKVDLRGDILVAGTVTVCWAIHERKSFHASFHQRLDWKFAAAAAAGFIPIP